MLNNIHPNHYSKLNLLTDFYVIRHTETTIQYASNYHFWRADESAVNSVFAVIRYPTLYYNQLFAVGYGV